MKKIWKNNNWRIKINNKDNNYEKYVNVINNNNNNKETKLKIKYNDSQRINLDLLINNLNQLHLNKNNFNSRNIYDKIEKLINIYIRYILII